MSDIGWGFMGMHAFWWLFWIALIVVLFALFKPGEKGKRHVLSLDSLEDRYAEVLLLEDRYSAGEITDKEYEELKAKLDRHIKAGKWKN